MCKCVSKCNCKVKSTLSDWWLVLVCGYGKVIPIKDKVSLDKAFDNLMIRDWKANKPYPMFIFPPK